MPEFRVRTENEHDKILTAITVKICDATTAMRRHCARQAGVGADILKTAVPIVQPEAVRLIPSAGFVDPIVGVRIGGENILPSIVVDVDERRAPS